MRNIKNISLIVILILLVLAYAGIRLFRHTGRSEAFRENLVDIDTTQVTRLVIDKPEKSFEVSKSGNNWQVSIGEGKTADATASSVKNALSTLMRISPDRIVTRDPEKWKDYQVDTAGTNIKVYEGSKKALDLIIGKFGVQGRQQFHTYVRLTGDNEVYASDNFMGVSFPSDPNSFRNTRFLQMETDSIRQITFHYPADSSFILSKKGKNWFAGTQMADSAQVADYISDLRYVSASDFVDDINPAALINPVLSVDIQQNGLENIKLEAYQNPKYNFIFHSTYNPNSWFSDDRIMDRVFIGKNKLLK